MSDEADEFNASREVFVELPHAIDITSVGYSDGFLVVRFTQVAHRRLQSTRSSWELHFGTRLSVKASTFVPWLMVCVLLNASVLSETKLPLSWYLSITRFETL